MVADASYPNPQPLKENNVSRLTVTDLRTNMPLNKASFLLAGLTAATDRNGYDYLRLNLRDRSGDIEAMYWRVPAGVAERLAIGRGVAVTGRVEEYKGALQVNVEGIFPCDLEHPEDFLPMARRPQQEMVDELQQLINSIQDKYLKLLLKAVLGDSSFQQRFLTAAAAKTYHHACVGGLLEHSLDVARLVITAVKRYPELNRDLGVTVALLHDVGKVDSYTFSGDFDLTDEGKLFGHIYLGAARVDKAIDRIESFPSEMRQRVIHAILSHHGDLDKGSPVTPRTPEAIALHYADNLDGSLRGWIDHVHRESNNRSAWTSRSSMFEAELFVGQK